MKLKNKYIALATMGVAALSSCNDFLDVEAPSQNDQAMVYSSVEFATNAINGVYVLFGEDPYSSRMMGVWMQNTDVEAMGPSAGLPTAHRNSVWSLQGPALESFNDVYNVWNNNLQAIERANQVRAGVDASPIGDTDELQQIKGEATCLKAFRYYLMTGLFGDVPYYDEAAKAGDELDKPRTDKNIIFSKVLQQLVDIEPNMKFSDVNTGGIERMNRDFAIGLIARLALFRAGYGLTVDNQMKRADDYLDVTSDDLTVVYKDLNGVEKTAQTYTEYYQMAKDYCQKLIQLKPRELYTNYAQSFINEMNYAPENNAEVLYEVAFVQNYGGDVGWSLGVPNTGSCAKGTTTAQVAVTPIYYMSFADSDTRRDINCAKYSHANDTVAAAASTGLYVGKWDRALANKDLGSGSSKGTGINYPLMRYSDVLLMLAEAENELNGPTATAKEALKTVRARAFAGAADYDEQVNQYVNSLGSKEAFFNAIVDERAWELGGGEGLRKFDLVRWNLYAKKIEETLRTMICWGISTNNDLMNNESVLAAYPEARNYTDWAPYLYYAKSGSSNVKEDIKWYNQKWKVAEENEVLTAAGWVRLNWGVNFIKTVTTYTYNGTDYSACTKTVANGVATYALGTEPNQVVVEVADGEYPGITRHRKFQASDYATRLYRGYTGGALTGNGVVPYLIPINITTLNASDVLNNDGYCFATTDMGEGINVDITTIDNDYK